MKQNLKKRTSILKGVMFVCLFLTSIIGYAQERTISGTITDSNKEPLIGLSVAVEGTTTGVMTDLDGKYSISAKPGDILVFSYVGMQSQKITVANQSVIDVVMTEDAATMLNATVVIGYGTAKKRDLAGSIVSISAEDIANRPSSNPLASLQGKVSGVQIVNSGRTGQDPEIRIRGTNSINGYKPLYVVDGLFYDNVNFLNAADIESMEILKDPSSLAIFGVRGANGVIIVTTKKAKEGKTVVSINSSVGVKNIVNKVKMANGDQFREMYNEQLINEWLDGDQKEPFMPFDFSKFQANTNWQNEILRTAMVTDNNVSVSASTDKSNFYLGIGYMYEQGNIQNEKYNRITINLANDYSLTKNFKVGYQFTGARIQPQSTPTDEDGILNALRSAPVVEPYNHEYGMYNRLPNMQKNQITNPMLMVDEQTRTTKATNYTAGGNVYGDLNMLNNKLNFRVMLGFDYRTEDSRTYKPQRFMYDLETESIYEPDNNKSSIAQFKLDETKVQSDYVLTYTDKFGDHGLTATAGFTTFYNRLSKLDASRKSDSNLPISTNPDDWYVSKGDIESSTNGSDQWEKTTLSFLLRGLYNYKSKYIFNASFRRDGTSAFYYTGNEWQNFYSFGGGWIITEEEFMKDNGIIDYLKLKGSWGTLGIQDAGSAYPAYPLLGTNDPDGIFGDPEQPNFGGSPEYQVDKNLRWEKVEAWEVGIESYFAANRLKFEATYYDKLTKDMLIQLDGFAGTAPAMQNRGKMSNRGFEFSLAWNDKIGDDWRYGINANLATVRNRVKEIYSYGPNKLNIISGAKSIAYTQEGMPIGYFYGYKVDGVFQNQQEINDANVKLDQTPKPGDLRFKDVNGDGIIDSKDRTKIGNPTPDFTYGISLNLGYKNFDLSVDMMGVQGNEIYRTWDNYNWSPFNYMSQRVGRWTGEGTSNSQPILNTKRTINNLNSEYYIEDGSFFRIRNIQLSYQFDQSLVRKLRMSSLKVYVNAQNPVTWKNNTGYSPEIGGSAIAFGIDNGTYPVPAVYTFGFNLTF